MPMLPIPSLELVSAQRLQCWIFCRLTGGDGEFFFQRRETLEYFVKTQRHVAQGIGLRYDSGGESGFVHQKFRVAEHRGQGC